MPAVIHALLSPAEWAVPGRAAGADTICVVFDVLRATSTVVTALAHGARGMIPVGTLEEAVAWRRRDPECLLAGERGGLRPGPDQTGGVPFDFGNSPREFTPERVRDRLIVFTTTNGSRALQACEAAQAVLAGSFLNLGATVQVVRRLEPRRVTLVCAGTGPEAALEDVLAAGAFLDLWRGMDTEAAWTDAAAAAWLAWCRAAGDLSAALRYSANARRLAARAELRDDIAWCLQRDRFEWAVWWAGPEAGLRGGPPDAAVAALDSRRRSLSSPPGLC